MEQNISEILCHKAEELIRLGLNGPSVAGQLTDTVDKLLISAYESAVKGSHKLRVTSNKLKDKDSSDSSLSSDSSPDLALVAVGGYGRMEVAPYSDIDIMLLAKNRDSVNTDAAQDVLYRLWDMGLNISHCFRTLPECIEDSLSDLKTRTSLIESRFLAGDRGIFDEFKRDVYQKILFKNKKEFVRDMLREIDSRHKTYGDSVYLLEPDIKEGSGGLRDVHSASWLARVVLRLGELKEFRTLLPEGDYRHFMNAFDFLLRARLCLHLASKRRNDVLSFEFQEAVARRLGFKDTKRFLSEEIMMRLYYKKAGSVTDALKRIMNMSGRQYLKSFINLTPDFYIKKITDDFYVSRNEIIIKDSTIFKRTDKILEAFYVYSITGKKFSYQVREILRGRSLFINKTRVSGKAIHCFLDILKGDRVYETLREMHGTGILDRFIPEFGRLRHLVLYEPYHRYTVDEHTLIAIKNLEALKNTRHTKLRRLAGILKEVKQETLYLSVLLHDIGKGLSEKRFGRHEDSGYRMLKGILERFNIGGADRQRIEFLVKNHILLSKLALARDTDAPETVTQLAETVETEESLNALYLMTYADMTAVNPHFWTEWKAYLFYDIYKKAVDHLRGVRGRYYDTADEKLKKFIEDMPERYIVSRSDEMIYSDYALTVRAQAGHVAISIDDRPDSTAEIGIATEDMHGLFSRIVGALSLRGLNIVQARLYTGKSGLVVDKILVSNWKDIWWQGMGEQIKNDLKEAISQLRQEAGDGKSLCEPEKSTVPRFSVSPFHAECLSPVSKRLERFVEIDNETSDEYTILEIFLPDRLGLLYDISTRLYRHKVDIISAIINTEDEVARDVFYLQHYGGKLNAGVVFNVLNAVRDMGIGKTEGCAAAAAGS
ncbi:MAG: [protein-PII] uridylyltransferase [Nitrospirae bacterium]|nr:[protein-PII] uridylyltransferase [Nitrospirota bacterium]